MIRLWALFAAVIGMASCAPRVDTVPVPPKAKLVNVKPARESVARLGDQVMKARESAAKLDVQIGQAQDDATAAGDAAQRAFVDGLTAGSDAAKELKGKVDSVSKALAGAQESSIALAGALSRATAELETSKVAIADVQADVAAKQVEVEVLRASLDQANLRIERAAKLADQLAVAQSKLKFWRWTAGASIAFAVALLFTLVAIIVMKMRRTLSLLP